MHAAAAWGRGLLHYANQRRCEGITTAMEKLQLDGSKVENPPPEKSSTLNHVQCEAGQGSLLVARLHIEACLVHRLDHLIERDLVAF